jgi:carbonic anhydrase
MQKIGYWLIAFIIGLFAIPVYADEDRSSVTVKWGYKGNVSPAFWGRLDPAFSLCATGKSQSPINITKKVRHAANALTIHYNPAEIHIVNDGLTDLQIGKTHTVILDGQGVQLNFSEKNNKEEIELDGKKYRLVQFHFHTPSETQWHNQAYPLEIHFVHQNAEGEVAVIAVLAKGGAENATVKKIIAHLPTEVGKEVVISSGLIDPAALLPVNSVPHYRYTGSLTVPPCTEGIHWVVMANAITVSPAQIVSIRKAAMGPNARPVQPLNKRVISYVDREMT